MRPSRNSMLAVLVAAAALTTPLRAQSGSAAQWINTVNATPFGSSLQKTGGCGGCADAGATSAESSVAAIATRPS